MLRVTNWRDWRGKIVLKLDGDVPRRLHVQFSDDPDMRADAGRRVATLHHAHFTKQGAERTLWLERGEGFLALFDSCQMRCLERHRIRLNRRPFPHQKLREAAQNDQIGVLEALACLKESEPNRNAYEVAAQWQWHSAPILDALSSPLSAERESVLRLLEGIHVNTLDQICRALLRNTFSPSQLGDHVRTFAKLVYERARGQPYVDELFARPEWGSLIESSEIESDETEVRAQLHEALKSDWQSPEWRAAVQTIARRMPPDEAFELLLPQTHRAALDDRARSHLIGELAALIRRFQLENLQSHTARLFNDLINRTSFGFAVRRTLLNALLDRAEQLSKVAHPPRSDAPQRLRQWLYSLAQPLQTWCQAALNERDVVENAQCAARAASLCQSPQLQGVLMTFLERAGRPVAQAALFRALGDIRAEETSYDEPLAHRLAEALRKPDAEGIHAAAIYALERFLPYANSRCLLELIRDGLRGHLQYADATRLVTLIATHALFDLNDIATDALIESVIEQPERRESILQAWRAVPDPHFVRGDLLRALPRDANLRQALQQAVPSDADFAPLRDWLEALNALSALERTQSDLLERLRQMAELISGVVPGGVRPPKRLGDVNGFLSDAQAHAQAIQTQCAALDEQIKTLIQQRGVFGAQAVAFHTAIATLSETERMLKAQQEALKGGIRLSAEHVRTVRNQLQQLRREQNLSGEVGEAVEQVNALLQNVEAGRADLNAQQRTVEQALKTTQDQIKRLRRIQQQYERNDPSAAEIERLTERREQISSAISQLEQGRIDEINATIRHINEQSTNLRARRDNALSQWSNPERLRQHRERLAAQLANERQKRLNQLRAHRQSLESQA